MKSHIINSDDLNYSVDDVKFVPDTEYAARVRSSPNQAHYKGQWSEWSSEVHWKMEAAVTGESPPNSQLTKQILRINFFDSPCLTCVFPCCLFFVELRSVRSDPPSNTFVFGLAKVFIPLCVVVPLVLLIYYGPYKK